MPKGILNWSYKDATAFLKEHGFIYHKESPGSHEQWLSEDKKSIVDVNFIQGNEAYPPRTLESMIRDSLPSGFDKRRWRKWADTGGYCCK